MNAGPRDDAPFDAERFDRQVRFAPLGREGQARLARSRALLVGCGALGGVLAQSLARSGLGELVLVDRDVVELSNLPRQVLFDERHAREGTPKALAAVESLRRAGGPTRLRPHVTHLDADNLATLAEGCELLLDGTDNLATRYLLNDFCVERGLPWIYAAVVGGGGLVMPVLPGVGACLRCLFPDPPPPGSLDTCDTAGVVAPAVGAVASLAAGLALRILARPESVERLEPSLLEVDVWHAAVRQIRATRADDCPACVRREFPFLHLPAGASPERLCGRNTVQIPGRAAADLPLLAERLRGVARDLSSSEVLVRFHVEDHRLTVFRDGRALVEGTEDVARAQALYDRYVGA